VLAINKENHHYVLPDEDELQTCVQDITTYTCEQNLPVYYAEANTPCKVQVYIKVRTDPKLQKMINIIKNHFVNNINGRTIVALLNSKTAKKKITIKCENEVENMIILNKIGKLSVSRKCKITTPHIILCTQKAIKAKVIQVYLPKFNLTLDYKNDKEIKSGIKIAEKHN